MISRRNMLLASAVLAVGTWQLWRRPAEAGSKKTKFEIEKTDAEWQKVLTPQQYYVMRKHGTERAFTHPYDKNYAAGIYNCAACDLPLYDAATKFDSGTGWPSFYAAIDDAVGTSVDYFIGYPRTEVHCRRCGGHLGHIFNDGPPPTGKRHCINGVSLKFVAKTTG